MAREAAIERDVCDWVSRRGQQLRGLVRPQSSQIGTHGRAVEPAEFAGDMNLVTAGRLGYARHAERCVHVFMEEVARCAQP